MVLRGSAKRGETVLRAESREALRQTATSPAHPSHRRLPCSRFFVSAARPRIVSSSASTSPRSPDASVSTPRRADAIHVVAGWRRGLAVAAGLLMRVWCASLRVHFSEETRALVADDVRPALFVLWHNRLFAAARLSRMLRPQHPLHCLVSASKDGAWLSAFFESAGLRVVRGSSSRGGREAAVALVDVLREGHDAGITPDGPRGPIYVCKPGAVVVARRAKVRVVLLGICYENAWRLRSWDKFGVPHPFSAVHLRVEQLSATELEQADARERIESRLIALNPEFHTSAPSLGDRSGLVV